jgi:hypothetical protein
MQEADVDQMANEHHQTYKGRLTAADNFKEECLARTVVFWEDQVVI